MAQPGLHSTATAVSTKAKVSGKNKKRKKSTMAGGACATGGICSSDNGGINSGAIWGMEAAWSDPVGRAGGGGVMSCAKGMSGDAEVLAMSGGIIISAVMNEGQ